MPDKNPVDVRCATLVTILSLSIFKIDLKCKLFKLISQIRVHGYVIKSGQNFIFMHRLRRVEQILSNIEVAETWGSHLGLFFRQARKANTSFIYERGLNIVS